MAHWAWVGLVVITEIHHSRPIPALVYYCTTHVSLYTYAWDAAAPPCDGLRLPCPCLSPFQPCLAPPSFLLRIEFGAGKQKEKTSGVCGMCLCAKLDVASLFPPPLPPFPSSSSTSCSIDCAPTVRPFSFLSLFVAAGKKRDAGRGGGAKEKGGSASCWNSPSAKNIIWFLFYRQSSQIGKFRGAEKRRKKRLFRVLFLTRTLERTEQNGAKRGEGKSFSFVASTDQGEEKKMRNERRMKA